VPTVAFLSRLAIIWRAALVSSGVDGWMTLKCSTVVGKGKCRRTGNNPRNACPGGNVAAETSGATLQLVAVGPCFLHVPNCRAGQPWRPTTDEDPPPRGDRDIRSRLREDREFSEDTGFSRAKIYNDLNAGAYRAVKDGKSTLIDVASYNDHCASCPEFESKATGAA
jgi:hypothetical protein